MWKPEDTEKSMVQSGHCGVDGDVFSAGGGGISYLSTGTGGGKPGGFSVGPAARGLLGEHGIHQVVENEV